MSGHRGFRWRWFSAGLLIGAFFTGALIIALARPISWLPHWRLLIVLLMSAVFGIVDVVGKDSVSFPRRQTYSGAASFAGVRAGSVIWGIDLGLGLTTYRVSRAYWSGLIMLTAGSPPVLSFGGTCAYVASFLWSVRKKRSVYIPESFMIRRRRLAGVVVASISTALIAVVISV